MKMKVADHVELRSDKLSKVVLAGTARFQLDLYCVAPGQVQKPHTHAAQDKVYYMLKGAGRFSL